MNTIKNIFLSFALLLGLNGVFAQSANSVIDAIQEEVDRNMAELRLEGLAPPLYISFTVADLHTFHLSASLGTIRTSSESRSRRGLPRVLVGDYMRNTAKAAGSPGVFISTSLDDNAGLPISIWRILDFMYKDAAERHSGYLAALQQQTRTPEEEALPDFEQREPVNMILEPVPFNVDRAYWENFLRSASEVVKQFPDILDSNLALNIQYTTSYTYDTEGSRFAVPTTFYQLILNASVRTDDGQDIHHTMWVENATFEQMPDLATFINQCKEMLESLVALRNAPLLTVEYRGPVLLEGDAVPVIFRRAFLNNNRFFASPRLIQPASAFQGQAQTTGGNDFELSIGRRVISRDISIKSISGQEFFNGQRLNGFFPIDSEGVVPDEELILIENGMLRNLLSNRLPTQNMQHSNGHGFLNINSNTWSVRPGNLWITSNQTFSNEELRQKLIETAREDGLDYAYIVRLYWSGGTLIYRVFVDDGREELVRGANVSGDTDLGVFNRILGSSNIEQISSFGGSVGEPRATIIHPNAMLFEELNITRVSTEFRRPFIVSRPE